MHNNIQNLRASLDIIDIALLQNLVKRLHIVKQIGEIKKEQGLPVVDNARKTEALQQRIHIGRELGLSQHEVERLYELLHDLAVEAQSNHDQ